METGEETKGCTFQWKIKNISQCWLKTGEKIDSPRFIADALEGTKWFLRLYPIEAKDKNSIAFYLWRNEDCVGPNVVKLNCDFAILDKDGSVLKKFVFNYNCPKGNYVGFWSFAIREKVFVTERELFLPEDTLTLQCTIWNQKVKPVKPQQLYAQTVFEMNRKTFLWTIEEFTIRKFGLKNEIKDKLIEFELVFNEGQDFEKNLVLNISSFDESIKYFSFKVSVVNSEGNKEICGTREYFAENSEKGVLCTMLSTKKMMLNKSRYFPNDVLSLFCEYVYSTGTVLYEHCGYGVISPDIANTEVQKENELHIRKDKSQIIPLILNDLKSMYNDQILSDMEFRTSTQNFPVHKNILSARSPVFRKMFSSDMKEKNNGYVDIHDLEEDTVQRMLLYIYTDTLEDMSLEDACKLYAAADKYEILSLRSSCSSFLMDKLCSNKACEVLVLADQHQDDDLKRAVQNFILQHDKEVFGSLEWKHFIDANSKLAADMMYRFTLCKINEP